MRTNYLCADTAVMRKHRNYGVTAKKASPRKPGYAVHSGIDDFLKSCPIFSRNEYGEKVISGRRIC